MKRDITTMVTVTHNNQKLDQTLLLTGDNKPHLSVCMLYLPDDQAVNRAIQILDIHKFPKPAEIKLQQGMSVLNGTPKQTRVLVADPIMHDVLDTNLQSLRKKFVRSELSDSIRPTTWHMTVLMA